MNNAQILAVLASASLIGSSLAAVSIEEAKQLGITGTPLTPVGAIRAGNKEGTIPAWNNEGVKPPAGFDPRHGGHRPNPWPDEKPLYTITAQNMDKYLDKITEGEIFMLKKYPDFRMDIYPTHRPARYPEYLLENSIKNATQCKLDAKGELENCLIGVPFPIPKNGLEVVWNHTLAFRWIATWGDHVGWLIDAAGKPSMVGWNDFRSTAPAFLPQNKDKILTPDTVYWQYRQIAKAPAREAGSQILIIDRSGYSNSRRAWQYIPGQRRIKLAPDLSFDTPLPQGGSAATFDDVYTFFGSPERYDWTLVGKQEKYIWANNYDLTMPKCSVPKKLARKNFPDPDCIRWELRRVWVVEANLKSTTRHIYKKRRFYWDEDNLVMSGTAVNYDAADKPYRISHSAPTAGYNLSGPVESSYGSEGYFVSIDLVNGSWLLSGGEADAEFGWALGHPSTGPVPNTYFTPEAAAAEGIR